MDAPARLAKETSEVCEELDYELLSGDHEWQDWRFEEDGTVKTVGINFEENTVLVEIITDGEVEFSQEYASVEGATARLVKRKL